jgi:hypothetical protein
MKIFFIICVLIIGGVSFWFFSPETPKSTSSPENISICYPVLGVNLPISAHSIPTQQIADLHTSPKHPSTASSILEGFTKQGKHPPRTISNVENANR